MLREFPTFSISPVWKEKNVILGESLALSVGFCDPSKDVAEHFCRIVGISRISCTIPRRRSHASCPIYTLRPPQTPKCLDLQVSPCYYTTWQNLAEFVEFLQSPSQFATFRHWSSLTTPNYGVICRRLWYYQDFKVHQTQLMSNLRVF